jgi:cytochrome c oxidase accessory protein FixG
VNPQDGVVQEISLYEVRQKIYPRAVRGWFAAWRWAMVWATQLVFYGGPWLAWNDRQALLFDIEHRKFYLFGLVFWPQDIIYLSVLLIVSALSLFLFTAVAGRLWCGYACPQTVYTEIFLWIERVVEGDRNARMRLDKQGITAQKILRKAAKHGLWIALAFWTGVTFVGYFTPIRELLTTSPGPWEAFWVLFYGFATYGNAGWMREQVCKYMCPYARFQSAMFDKDTLIITYDEKRGEPRGKGQRKGDCVDCGICVQVCPTGIDIRKGLQYECIACGACIDGCNEVMDKLGYPKGLIRYTTQNAIDGNPTRILRPRIIVYGVLLTAICTAWMWGVSHRAPFLVEVLRDRNALYRVGNDGSVENTYTVKIVNKSDRPARFRLELREAPAGATLRALPADLTAPAGEVIAVPLMVAAPAGTSGRAALAFALTDEAGMTREVASSFFGPVAAP